MVRVFSIIVICVAVFLYFKFESLKEIVGHTKEIPEFHDTCRLLPLSTAVEDITSLGDGHCAIAGGGDLWNTFNTGSATALPGTFWLVNATQGNRRALEVTGDGAPKNLILHGLYYSQRTQKLYAVNHDDAVGETVEVFELEQDWSALRHVASVASPLWNNMALNDVVEGALDGEFYVTEWLPVGMPLGGKKKVLSLSEKLTAAYSSLIITLQIPTTRVFRCTLTDGCRVASAARGVGFNGIARSQDGQTIYVNDPALQSITVLARQTDGDLVPISSFKTKHAIDNMEMDAFGRLNGGSLPLLHTSAVVCEDIPFLSLTRVVNGREVGCHRAPGGLNLIELETTGEGEVRAAGDVDGLMHDGSLLSGISAAVTVGPHVLLGSPYSPGLLVCDLPLQA